MFVNIVLSANGYNVLLLDSDKDKAHVWLLNSCTVKGPSEQAFINEIRRAQTAGKVVIVSGCVPQANLSNKEWDGLSIIGVQQIDRVVEVVQESLMGNIVRFTRDKRTNIAVVEEQGTNNNAVGELNDDDDDYVTTTTLKKRKAGGATLDMPKIRKNPFIEIIPINTGCLNQCTYCKTKHARGDLGSYTPEEIVSRIESVVKEGVVEIWLTSEDLGAYGHDIGVKITDLLWKCIAKIEECDANNVVMIRVGMTNPPYILDLVDEMAQVLSHPRVYSFLHV